MEERNLEKKCVYKDYAEHVIHVQEGPNCFTCDGFGVDAEKNNWNCYTDKEGNKIGKPKYLGGSRLIYNGNNKK